MLDRNVQDAPDRSQGGFDSSTEVGADKRPVILVDYDDFSFNPPKTGRRTPMGAVVAGPDMFLANCLDASERACTGTSRG